MTKFQAVNYIPPEQMHLRHTLCYLPVVMLPPGECNCTVQISTNLYGTLVFKCTERRLKSTKRGNSDLGPEQVFLFLDLAHNFVPVAAEVAAGRAAVFLPRLQADPTEVILALLTPNSYCQHDISCLDGARRAQTSANAKISTKNDPRFQYEFLD